VPARECYHKSLTPLMEEVREQMGSGPVYISFDIDALDPSFAPGTGAYNSPLVIVLLFLADRTGAFGIQCRLSSDV